MTTETATDLTELAVLDDLRGILDALSVRRVFGDPHTIDGITIIPVGRNAGGGGGGGGIDADTGEGHGFGTGFGLGARPVGLSAIGAALGLVAGAVARLRHRRDREVGP